MRNLLRKWFGKNRSVSAPVEAPVFTADELLALRMLGAGGYNIRLNLRTMECPLELIEVFHADHPHFGLAVDLQSGRNYEVPRGVGRVTWNFHDVRYVDDYRLYLEMLHPLDYHTLKRADTQLVTAGERVLMVAVPGRDDFHRTLARQVEFYTQRGRRFLSQAGTPVSAAALARALYRSRQSHPSYQENTLEPCL